MTTLADVYLAKGSFGQLIDKVATDPETRLPIDISWATAAHFQMWRPGRPDVLVVDAAAAVMTGFPGRWTYATQAGDAATAGTFHAVLHLTAPGREDWLPPQGPMVIVITDRN